MDADEGENSSSNEEENEGNIIDDSSDNEDEEVESEIASDDADNEMENESDEEENTGWANALAKVLQQEKPKHKKYLVLSRAKKLADGVDAEKKLPFELEENSDVKPNVVEFDTKPSTDDLEIAMTERRERNDKLLQLRVKPSLMDQDRERSLKRISTKGVVQLFNAVRTQQRDLVDRLDKAGPLDHKRDEVLNNINKRQFLDMLMGGKRAKSENIDNPIKDEGDDTQPSQWSVLRDDFMTNKKLASHWNNDENNDEPAIASNNSMDSDDSN